MSISACIIAKNNEKTLRQCLESIRKLADEIIFVDTGSTDKTISIAKKFTGNILHFKWNNNFSDARNFALSHATKEWIFYLDTDETISKKNIPRIKEMLIEAGEMNGGGKSQVLGFSMIQRNYTKSIGRFGFVSCKNDKYAESKVAHGYVPRRMVRLFKNDKRIRFENAIHESVESSILKLGKIVETSIPVHHFGSLGAKPEKTRFYIEMEKKNPKKDFFQEYQIAAQLHGINEIDEALRHLEISISKNPIFALAWLEKGIIMVKKGNFQEAMFSLHKAEALQEHPMTYDHLGIVYGQLGEFQKAIDYFKKAIALSPDNADFHFNLALTYDKLGLREDAYHELKTAVFLNPKYSEFVKF